MNFNMKFYSLIILSSLICGIKEVKAKSGKIFLINLNLYIVSNYILNY